MKIFKVYYTLYDDEYWTHSEGSTIILAESADEAKKKLNGVYTPGIGQYSVLRVEEVTE